YSPSRFYPLCPPSPPLPPPPTLFPYTTLFRSVRAAARFRSPSAPPCRPVSPDGKWPLPDAELSHQKRMAAIGRAAHLYEPLVPFGTRLLRKVSACRPSVLRGPSARARRNWRVAASFCPVHASSSPRV